MLTLRLAEAVNVARAFTARTSGDHAPGNERQCVMVTEPGEHNQQRVVNCPGLYTGESAKLCEPDGPKC